MQLNPCFPAGKRQDTYDLYYVLNNAEEMVSSTLVCMYIYFCVVGK